MAFIFTSIELTNKKNKLSITIESFVKGTGVLLTSFDDGQIQGEFNKFKGVNQHGQTINSTSLSERPINIEGIILADDRAQIEVLKRQLVRVLNPLQDVLLKYNENYVNKEIVIRADEIPKFSTDYMTNNENGLAFTCDLTAAYPFWQEQKETVSKIETWEGGFQFPFEIPSDGVEFAKKGPNELEFYNYSDVETPLEIFFNGPALKPVIKLVNDRSLEENKELFIKLNKQILDNEALYICTAYGKKRVEILKNDGTRENAYNYIDTKSTLFSLEVGENTLSYYCEGDFIPQSVIFKYKNKYLSL